MISMVVKKGRNKPGPKPKPKEKIKTVLLQVLVTESINNEIEGLVIERQKTKRMKYRKTDFLREAILNELDREKPTNFEQIYKEGN